MKTISLEVNEQVYQQVVNFLRLLPQESCHLLEEDPDKLSKEEINIIEDLQNRLKAGDHSDFEDWTQVRDTLK